jgi:hypothetical protein
MIEREATQEERMDFEPIGKEDNAKSRFYDELTKKEQESIKKGLPFASIVAINDFKDAHEGQIKGNIRKNGYLVPSELKAIKMDWKKYSDVSNFDLIKEDEISDPNLTKHNPGLNVMIAYRTYKYKGYNNTYQVMESPTDAILRARKKLKELEGK